MDILFDIDGTIFDNKNRLHHIIKGKKNWTSYDQEIVNDKPFDDIVFLLKTIFDFKSVNILFVSGRKESLRKITTYQIFNVLRHTKKLSKFKMNDDLASKFINEIPIYLRKEKDHRIDHEIKSDMLDLIIKNGFAPKIVFDDRNSVVKMWRDRGLTCLHVRDNPL